MKKHFYFYLSLFLFSNCFSQNINTAFHRYYETPGQFVKINNKLFFSSVSDTTSFVAPCFFYGMSGNNTLFRKNVSLSERTTITDMIATSDKQIVFIGSSGGCDVGGNAPFLFKMDTLGNIIFKEDSAFVSGDFQKIIEYTDSTFFIVTPNTLYHFSKNGNLLSIKTPPVNSISAMCLKNNHIILSSTNKLTEIDTACNIISQNTVSYSFNKLKYIGNNCIIGLTSTSVVCKINAALAVIANSQSAQGTYKLSDFSLSNDTIYCSAHDTSNALSVFKIDTAFVNSNLFSTGYTYTIPAKISSDNASLYFLNTEDNVNGHNPNISVLEMSKATGLMSVTQDAGVTNVVLDTAYATVFTQYPSAPGGPTINYYTYYYRMKLTLKNFGITTLNGCYINNHPYSQLICGAYYYSQYFSGLNLAPTQTITLTTPFIQYEGPTIVGPPPTSNYPVTLNNLCFWTSAPDKQSDANHQNDAACTNISFIGTVGIKSFADEQTTVSCYPNPATGSFTISSTQKIDAITITNLLGQTIAQTNPNTETTELNISKAGVYFVYITIGNKTSTQKIIIAN